MMMSTITSMTKPAAMTNPIMRNIDAVPLPVRTPSVARILSGGHVPDRPARRKS
jgi:hypothetical protein